MRRNAETSKADRLVIVKHRVANNKAKQLKALKSGSDWRQSRTEPVSTLSSPTP